MYAFLEGTIDRLMPPRLWLACHGVGYELLVSLSTSDVLRALPPDGTVRVYVYLQVKEDAHTLYGFATEDEKALFELLLSVSGVGGVLALTLLSSLSPVQIVQAIRAGDEATLERVKGIGKKTAGRLVLELKDRIGRLQLAAEPGTPSLHPPGRVPATRQVREEALAALGSLGFSRSAVEKKVDQILETTPQATLDFVIRAVLKGA
jgi:Holliday junction DNA helicase RuvA